MGFQTEEQARERVVQTLLTFTTSWPREPNHGFLVHFSNRNFEALSEFSTIDTAELILGAMFAGILCSTDKGFVLMIGILTVLH